MRWSIVSAWLVGCAGLACAPHVEAFSAAPDAHAARLVRCESIDNAQRHCPADLRGGVRLVRQLSKRACIEGGNWGTDREGIWVRQGCRAEFALGQAQANASSPRANRVVRCDSRGNRWNHCDADTRRGVQLVRQLSDRACIRDRSWGVDERGIWVSAGCRAEFLMLSGREDQDDDLDVPLARVVRCESRDGRPARCPVATDGGVRLVRQWSKAPCTVGRSWGHDDDGIWVERGCRADFEVTVPPRKGWRWWR